MPDFDCDLLYLLQLWGRNDFNSFVFRAIPKFLQPNEGIIDRYMTVLTSKVAFGRSETRYIQLGRLSHESLRRETQRVVF